MILNKFNFCIFLFFILYQTNATSKISTDKDFNPRYLSNYLSAIISYNNQNNENSIKYFNASKNFKSPTLKELYMQWDHLGMFYINGNKDLNPETSNYASISYEKFNARSNFTVKPYLHYLENMIASVEELELSLIHI